MGKDNGLEDMVPIIRKNIEDLVYNDPATFSRELLKLPYHALHYLNDLYDVPNYDGRPLFANNIKAASIKEGKLVILHTLDTIQSEMYYDLETGEKDVIQSPYLTIWENIICPVLIKLRYHKIFPNTDISKKIRTYLEFDRKIEEFKVENLNACKEYLN